MAVEKRRKQHLRYDRWAVGSLLIGVVLIIVSLQDTYLCGETVKEECTWPLEADSSAAAAWFYDDVYGDAAGLGASETEKLEYCSGGKCVRTANVYYYCSTPDTEGWFGFNFQNRPLTPRCIALGCKSNECARVKYECDGSGSQEVSRLPEYECTKPVAKFNTLLIPFSAGLVFCSAAIILFSIQLSEYIKRLRVKKRKQFAERADSDHRSDSSDEIASEGDFDASTETVTSTSRTDGLRVPTVHVTDVDETK